MLSRLFIFFVSSVRLMAMTDQEVVALTLLGEARGEGRMGMYLVGCVIQQRSEVWNGGKSTPREVCLKRLQFSCWNGKGVKRELIDTPEGEYALWLANHIVKGTPLQREVVGFADHYHTHFVSPKWSRGKVPTRVFGGHRFFRLR
jgi:N-acetylmuramoyl-L-alanine amidase